MSSLIELKDSSIQKLGVFDSGLGGLTVLDQLLKTHPSHDYIYFGDTAHVPYGSRDAENVIGLVSEIASYLVDQDCQGLILACNTSSALALSALQEKFNVPIVGVIDTASKEAARVTHGHISVLANPLTARSGVYRQKITQEHKNSGRDFELQVHEIGCPDLVSIIEENRLETQGAFEILTGYAQKIQDAKTDTLVLGCTHYPLLLPVLSPLLGKSINIVNPATLIPELLGIRTHNNKGSVEYKVSGSPQSFDSQASTILARSVGSEQVTLTKVPKS